MPPVLPTILKSECHMLVWLVRDKYVTLIGISDNALLSSWGNIAHLIIKDIISTWKTYCKYIYQDL